jgi:hypothetical protein
VVVLVDEYDKPILDNLTQVKEALLSSFEVENIGVEALLFQTGYLTIVVLQTLGAARITPWVTPTAKCWPGACSVAGWSTSRAACASAYACFACSK